MLSGYDGKQPVPNPTALLLTRHPSLESSLVTPTRTRYDVFSILLIFKLMIYYDYLASSLNSTTGLRNRTLVDYTSPLMVGYIGPSITPLSQVGVYIRWTRRPFRSSAPKPISPMYPHPIRGPLQNGNWSTIHAQRTTPMACGGRTIR